MSNLLDRPKRFASIRGNFAARTPAMLLVLLVVICTASAPARAQQCNRACLGKILDQYLAAVFHHEPNQASLAASYRATENAVLTPAGEGIWKTATGYGEVERRYFDATTGQAAYFGLLREGEATDIVSLRLKTNSQRKVTEAEWTIARKAYTGVMDPQGLVNNPPPTKPLPRSERASRQTLIATANAYFQGLQDHEGTNVPKIDGCDRVENGVRMTHRTMSGPPGSGAAQTGAPTATQEADSGDCTANFEGFAKTIAETSHRRFPFVDEDFGLVIGMTLFHRPPEATMKRNLLTEYFFQRNGKLAYIAAAMFYLDPSAPDDPGWPTR